MLLHALALYATASLFGAMLFFSFAVTPVVFATLEAAQASRLIRALFPVYYLVIILCGAVAAVTLAVGQRPLPAAAMALVAGLAVLTRQLLIPQLDALRPGREAGDATATRRFRLLHGASMALNLAQILAVAGVLAIFVA